MPKGRASNFTKNKNKTNNSAFAKKTLDINEEPENVDANVAFNANKTDNEKIESPSAAKESTPEVSVPKQQQQKTELASDEYTIDPHTGQKYLKPKGDSHLIRDNNMRIPQINRPGYEVIWPIDRDQTSIPNLIKKGWEFVDPNTPGCENAIQQIYAGQRPDGSPMFHKAMQMPKEKYLEMQVMEGNELDKKESDTIFNPAIGDDKLYLPREFRRPNVTRNNRDMDIGMAAAFDKAMR